MKRAVAVAAICLALLPSIVLAAEPKALYLTFDADMTPSMRKRLAEGKVAAWYDPSLIRYLEQKRLPATVYMTGMFAEVYPSLAHRLGHDPRIVIGNHTYDHASFEARCYKLKPLTTDDEKRQEVLRAQAILKTATGQTPTSFRYPGLCRDAHDDAIVTGLGLSIDDGTIVSDDAFTRSATTIVEAVLRQAKPGGVILMHLGGPNAPMTGVALRRLVPLLERRGYTFGAR